MGAILGGVLLALVVGSSVWVFFDIRKKGVYVKGAGPLGWTLACLSCWVLFFPYYLLNRQKSEITLPLNEKFPREEMSSGLVPASAGKRFFAGLIDLVVIPVFLGVVIGWILLTASDATRSMVLIIVNVGWLLFRDTIYSPGRAMIRIKIVSLFDKQGSSLVQAYERNVCLVFPFVLVPGYLCESKRLMASASLIARRVTYVLWILFAAGLLVVSARTVGVMASVPALLALLVPIGLLFLDKTPKGGMLVRRIVYGFIAAEILFFVPGAVSAGGLAILGVLLMIAVPVVFLALDKEAEASGRLADLWAKTLVVEG